MILITFISSTALLLSLIALVNCCSRKNKKPKEPKVQVGDIYCCGNPGKTIVPGESNSPFVIIEEVVEVVDGKFRTLVHSVRWNGKANSYDSWHEMDHFDHYGERLYRGTPLSTEAARAKAAEGK